MIKYNKDGDALIFENLNFYPDGVNEAFNNYFTDILRSDLEICHDNIKAGYLKDLLNSLNSKELSKEGIDIFKDYKFIYLGLENGNYYIDLITNDYISDRGFQALIIIENDYKKVIDFIENLQNFLFSTVTSEDFYQVYSKNNKIKPIVLYGDYEYCKNEFLAYAKELNYTWD